MATLVKRKTLGRLLYTLISSGVNMSGTFDPLEILPYIEEQLTCVEYNQVEHFLEWVHNNDKQFGSGNYEQVYQEYLKATE